MFFKNAKMAFLRVLYPIGRCFLILYPPNAQEYIFNGMILSQNIKDVSNFEAGGYIVLFLDKESGLSFKIKFTPLEEYNNHKYFSSH